MLVRSRFRACRGADALTRAAPCGRSVPKGKDRIRTQVSAGHTKEDLDFAVKCFKEVKEEMGI